MSNQTPEARTRGEEWQRQREREDRAARQAAFAFIVAIVAALGLFVVYVLGGQTQLEGTLLFVSFAGLGVGLGIWVKVVIGPQELVEDRPLMQSQQEHREAFASEYDEAVDEAGIAGRRRFLIRLLMGAGASLGLALLIPLRSLGPGPERELFTTAWRRGSRLVDVDGRPVLASDVIADQVLTVFPENHLGEADAQTILVGLRPGREAELEYDTVANIVAYSKICTHAGCPVGLYRASQGELLCPCHQSVFDVYDHARVLSGPAGRGLPQLPLGTDDEGFLIALSEYPEPVGPTFWNLTHERGDA